MNRIKLTTDYIYNEKVANDITIVHISDIHFSIKTKAKELSKINKYIDKIDPSYIMITGDLIDEPSITKNNKIKELIEFLRNLGKKRKVLICLGNHDVYMDGDFQFFQKLDDLKNIYILNNKNYTDEYINVLGLTLPNNYYYNCCRGESVDALVSFLDSQIKLLNKINSDTPNVLLIHSPIKLTVKEVIKRLKNYDLILCGHTHNGIVPDLLKPLFPKNIGLISPRKGLFPEIAKGKIIKEIDNKKITIIINGAITKLSNRSGITKLNFIYNKDINKIIITKKRGKKYE